MGWAKNIRKILDIWEIDKEWNVIATMTKNAWKKEVEKAAEKRNKIMLSEECMIRQRGEEKCKTKTKSILKILDSPTYKRQALPILTRLTSIESRALIMGRYGMLDCRANFSKGYGGKLCEACNVIDDEMHRVNFCQKYYSINRYDNPFLFVQSFCLRFLKHVLFFACHFQTV